MSEEKMRKDIKSIKDRGYKISWGVIGMGDSTCKITKGSEYYYGKGYMQDDAVYEAIDEMKGIDNE